MHPQDPQTLAAWIQGIAAVVSIVATLLIGWVGYRVSINQLKPFLYIDVTSGKDHTIILLKNEGLGPAKITTVWYRLKAREPKQYHRCEPKDKFEPWREDSERRRDQEEYHYLLKASEVIPGANTKLCLSSQHPYWQTCDLAGVVIGAGKEVEILQAYIKYDPSEPFGANSRSGKQWQAALRNKLAHGEIKIEYEDANGRRIKPLFTCKLLFPSLKPQEEELLEELAALDGENSSANKDPQQANMPPDTEVASGNDQTSNTTHMATSNEAVKASHCKESTTLEIRGTDP